MVNILSENTPTKSYVSNFINSKVVRNNNTAYKIQNIQQIEKSPIYNLQVVEASASQPKIEPTQEPVLIYDNFPNISDRVLNAY